MEATPNEIAWAAGLFEGEGTAYFYKAKASVNLRLVSTDKDVVHRFHEIIGHGGFYVKKKTTGFAKKTQYVWATGAINEARAVATLLLPWMGERRRKQMLDVFDAYNTARVKRNKTKPCGRFA